VGWARLTVAFFVALSFLPTATERSTAPLHPETLPGLRLVVAAGVETHLPPKWQFRPLPDPAGHRQGIQASAELLGMMPTDLRHPGLEAYWVDATRVGVPSDYYELAARGPVLDLLEAAPGCQTEMRRVATGHRHPSGAMHAWPGHYVATVTGTCDSRTSQDDTRWAEFVAAPGFGPERALGIARSGLYVVRASVPDGPDADRRLRLLMGGISFGGTPLGDFLSAAGLPVKLP
jgi:hypothetical protein